MCLEQDIYIVRRHIKNIVVFRIELKKNVGLVTGCNIFSSYFSCFGLLADTRWFKVNDGGSLLYQVFRIIMTPTNSSRRGWRVFRTIVQMSTPLLTDGPWTLHTCTCSTCPSRDLTSGGCFFFVFRRVHLVVYIVRNYTYVRKCQNHKPVWGLYTSAATPPSLLFSVASTTNLVGQNIISIVAHHKNITLHRACMATGQVAVQLSQCDLHTGKKVVL